MSAPSQAAPREGLLERLAGSLVSLAERYLPDAYVFALAATVLVVAAGLFDVIKTGTASPWLVIDAWGKGLSSLLPFTLQMALIIIGGHVVASAAPVARLIDRVAGWPRTGPGAVALLTFLSLATSFLNWGFSLIFSALLARALARRLAERGVRVDYRALAAASFLGLGSIWAQGLSGSAALQMATPGSLPEPIARVVAGPAGAVPGGLIPLSRTIFLWQSLVAVVLETVVVTLLMLRAAPRGERARTAADLGIALDDRPPDDVPPPSRPGERWEHTPVLAWAFVLFALCFLSRSFRAGKGLDALNLNTVNLLFLTLGVLLHRTPARLMAAYKDATPAVWGVLLQFPLYGGIAGVISATHLNERLAGLFVAVANRETFPPLCALYSALLGVFVPSGGSKWLIEAPYVMAAAHQLRVHLGWMVAVYDLGEALANLIQPFWMLPVLALLRLRARDVMGYTTLIFLFLTPLVVLLTWLLGRTLPYPL